MESFETLDVGPIPHFVPSKTEHLLKKTCLGVQKNALELITSPKKLTKKQAKNVKEFVEGVDQMAKIIKNQLSPEAFDWFEIDPEFKVLVNKAKLIDEGKTEKKKIEKFGRRKKSAVGVKRSRRSSRKENIACLTNSFVY